MSGHVESEIPLGIPEFYKGKSVFTTGFTGYLGKLVVEKILYSCPDVDKIYVLVRPKKGQDPRDRLNAVCSSMAFDRLKEKYPGALETKVIPVEGDLISDRLGLSSEDEQLLAREVSIIFHTAATVRFDETLKNAVQHNSLGTKKIIDLALKMTKLESFVYMSTAYSNSDNIYIKEELYPAKAGLEDTVKICEKIDPATLSILTKKYLGGLPNTYTFSKSLAEHVVNDHRDRIPAVITRPSIVISALREPIPGWVDNKFGPIIFGLGSFTGILRCAWIKKDEMCNYIYSDAVINSAIIASWKRAVAHRPAEDAVQVYNVCSPAPWGLKNFESSEVYKVKSLKELDRLGINFVYMMMVDSKFWFWINTLYRHMLPALFVDLCLRIAKKKPILVKLRRIIYTTSVTMGCFTMTTFKFENSNFTRMLDDLSPEDRETFGWTFNKDDIPDWFHTSFLLTKQTIIKPLFDDFKAYQQRLKMLYYIDTTAVIVTYSTIAGLIYLFNVPATIFNFLQSLVYFL